MIKIDPKKAEFFQMRGYFQLKLDQFENAVESYQRAIRLDPNNPETYDKLATAWAAEDRLQEAIDLYREAMEVNPDNAEIRIIRRPSATSPSF